MKICGKGKSDFLDKLRRRAATRGVSGKTIDWNTSAKRAESAIARKSLRVRPSMERRPSASKDLLRYMRCGRAQVCCANGAQRSFLQTELRRCSCRRPTFHALAGGHEEARLHVSRHFAQTRRERPQRVRHPSIMGHLYTRRMRKIYYNELNIEGRFLIMMILEDGKGF